MILVLTWLIIASNLALGAWATVRAVRNQPVVLRQLFAAGAIEAFLVIQVLVAIVGTATGSPVAEPVTFWGYVITVLLVLPAAAAVSFVERSRWSSVILLVAALTTGFLQFRVLTLWVA